MKVVLALLLGLATGACAESNDSPEALKKAEAEVQQKLDVFAKDSADYESLLVAQKLSVSLYPRGGSDHLSALGEECLRLQWKVLLTLAGARDPHYDRQAPENRVSINVAPPFIPGHSSPPAGVAPNAVEDPLVRKAYEEAIAQNKQRGMKLNREIAISRGLDHAMINLWVLAHREYPENSALQKEVVEIVQQSLSDKTLLERFNSKKMPGITW